MLTLIVVLAVLGAIVYMVEQIPMSPPFKTVIRVIAVLAAILILLRAVGFGDLAVPQVR